jgi:hypothetical protein
MAKHIFIGIFCFVLGIIATDIYFFEQDLKCADYSTKYGMWLGYKASKNGEVRCFWVESYYPYRVRQGVVQ